jgi:hypothetical protein
METATSIELFVEILDRYVYYFDQKNESVSDLVDCNVLIQPANPTFTGHN